MMMDPVIADMIIKDVVDQLKWDDSVDDSNITVKVSDNHVTLEGFVNSYAAKLAATRDAYLVPGVKNVKNNLRVLLSDQTGIPNDEQITASIGNSLRWHSRIDASDIEVETNNRNVTLRGKVTSFWEKFDAEDIAVNTLGVVGVINLLEVRLGKTVADQEIESDLNKAFERLIDEDILIVACMNGVVRLSGSVANFAIKREALDLAHYTRGVLNVIDEITIE